MSTQKTAQLRVCASCEWIYKGTPCECPKCGFASYGAHWVYGDKAYQYAKTQKPWMDIKMFRYRTKLLNEINDAACIIPKEGIPS
jgi:hypothetical protein